MKNTNITRDDVAKLAGVSPATVSNVINNKGNVKEFTRNKVLKAIDELEYTPNSIARSLMLKSTKHIGLLVDDISNPHFAEFTKGAHHEAVKQGYLLSIALASYDIEKTINDFISRQVDGIIINAYSENISSAISEKIVKNNIKLVGCSSIQDYGLLLSINYNQGAKLGFDYLIENGHENIALVSGLEGFDDLRNSQFRSSYIDHFGSFDNNIVVFGKPPFTTNNVDGYNYAKELYSRSIDPTAIIVGNDFMAVGVLKYLNEIGKKVPNDVSIITYDNTILADTNNLTSVYAPVFSMGEKAVSSIVEDTDEAIGCITYNMSIKKRNSVKNLKK